MGTRRGGATFLSYHWLDPLGNPLVFDGLRTPLPDGVPPGGRIEADVVVGFPASTWHATDRLRSADRRTNLVRRCREPPLTCTVRVLPRLRQRTLAVSPPDGPAELVAASRSALEQQEEPITQVGEATAFLAAGCAPAPDWSRRILDSLEEGFGAVAGSIDVLGGFRDRRALAEVFAPWKPGFGRAPGWSHSLLCPAVVADRVLDATWTPQFYGLPSLDPGSFADLWLCDGRIRVEVDATTLLRAGRPPA